MYKNNINEDIKSRKLQFAYHKMQDGVTPLLKTPCFFLRTDRGIAKLRIGTKATHVLKSIIFLKVILRHVFYYTCALQ